MAANKIVRFGPTAMVTGSTPDILNCTITSVAGPVPAGLATQPYLIVRHICIVNKTAGAITFSLYLGATGAAAAGTEVIGTATSIPANSAFHWYGMMRMDTPQFLTGSASANTSLVIQGEAELGFI